MIVAGSGLALWQLMQRHLPMQAIALSRHLNHIGTPEGGQILQDTYRDMPAADFSRDVLERARGLTVESMIDAGWSDCGTPERLVSALKGTPALGQLIERLGLSGRIPGPAIGSGPEHRFVRRRKEVAR